MKLSTLAILFFITILTAVGQTNKPKTIENLKSHVKTFKNTNDRRYQIKYDKFTDKTTVLYLGDALNSAMSYVSSGTMIQISGAFSFSGDKMANRIEEFALIFRSTGKNWEFLKNQHLYVLADGERFDLGESDRDSDVGRGLFGEVQTSETLIFPVKRADFEKFSAAKTLEIKVGNREFTIKPNTQIGFINLLALSSTQ